MVDGGQAVDTEYNFFDGIEGRLVVVSPPGKILVAIFHC
jgi:hypothetical protein